MIATERGMPEGTASFRASLCAKSGCTRFRAEAGCLVAFGCAALILAAPIVLPALRSETGRHHETCANYLKELGIIMKMYAGENHRELYPTLSPVAGVLFWDNAEKSPVYPDYFSDAHILICADEAKHLKQSGGTNEMRFASDDGILPIKTDSNGKPHITYSSYLYLGYVLTNDEETEAFAETYKSRVAGGKGFDDDLPALAGKGSFGGNIFLRLSESSQQEVDTNADTAKRESTQRRVPVLVERLGNHDSYRDRKCNVLFLDGHVESISLGEKWPVTDRTMKALESIEKLARTHT